MELLSVNMNIFYPVAIGLLTAIGSGLAGHLASTKWWHKWIFWGSGALALVLIYFQARAYKEPPTAKEIAHAVVQEEGKNVQTARGEVPSQKPELEPAKPPSTVKPKKPQPKPKPNEVTPPSTSPPPAPQTATLFITQSPDVSTRTDAAYKTRVVIQSNHDFPSLKLLVQCDGPLVDGSGGFTGILMMTSQGVVKDHPNLFFLTYQSATPPFGPANPIVLTLWSKQPIQCKQVATF